MMWIKGAIATCFFELKRSFTLQRGMVAAVLSLFPPAMVFLLLFVAFTQNAQEIIGELKMMVVLLVSLVCVLSILLWATPNVYSELEGKSWIFSASRPKGRTSLLLGKYLASVFYSFMVCEIAICLSLFLAVVFNVPSRDVLADWAALSGIFLLGSITFGAIFSLIGTLFFKRAMVVGAVYVIVVECICGMMPSLIGKFTFQYHLRSLGLEWLGFFLPPPFEDKTYKIIYGDHEQWFHLACLGGATIVILGIAIVIINWRQYITSDET